MNRRMMVFLLIAMVLPGAFHADAQQPNTNLSNLVSFDGEPSIAVNPANPGNLIAAWMRLRYDGKIWIAVRATFDGGGTWSPIQFIPHTQPDSTSADVSVAFHRSGTAYLLYVDFRMTPDTVGSVFLVHSTDGGLHWSAPREVISTRDMPDLPIDRPWLAVDNSGGPYDGTVYASSMTAFWHQGAHHIYLRHSSDRGETWSPVRQLDDAAFSCGMVAKSYGAISVGADGRFFAAYSSYDTTVSPYIRLYSAVTADAGSTWQRAVITNVALRPSDLGYAQGYSIAADPVRPGHAVVTWIDQRYGDSDVLMKRTTDGGLTWGVPVRINDDPQANGIEQDLVWTQYGTNGSLAIAWRDRRLSIPGVSAPFDIYARVSHDGGTTFDANRRLSSTSSPWIVLGCCNSFLGVALTDRTLFSIWGDYRSNDWDIYFHASSTTVAVDESDHIAPMPLTLERNFPNPFSDRTTIRFRLAEDRSTAADGAATARAVPVVSLKVYDIFGREVRTLIDGTMIPGFHEALFDGSGLPAGTYILRLSTAGASQSAHVHIVR